MHMSGEVHPQAAALYNRACELQQRQELHAAIAAYDEALALDPNFASAHSNRGAAFAAMNRCDEALASLDRAIDLKPDYAEAHFCRAVTLLMQGDLLSGWVEFEWRWKTAPGRALRQSKNFLKPRWFGEEAVAGRTLLLYAERGLGDTLQFCRYVPMVSQLRANVVLQVQAPLVDLLRRLALDIQVVGETEKLPDYDLHCPLLSLPLVFKTALATIPAPRRYLSADADEVARLRAGLASIGAPRVGLVWRGDANNPDDRNRSIALCDVLRNLPDELHYFSLQKEITPEELPLINAQPNLSVVGAAINFEVTAALCECLDLVIATDTSVAHLAAALGVRTWILLPFNADCRWLLEREDAPWYPTARLYRQETRGDWADVLVRVRADLERLARGAERL
jgi:tetratricopeptide (TPR) repeat protein